jgi:exonuclease SbcD
MRLLHTSDWHLGQTFHNFERSYEHQCFLGWLLDTLEAERADALLIAGDVFDHANPSAKSQEQLYRFLSEAKRRVPGLDIVMIAGNHDSPGRLEAPLPLLNAFDVRVIGQARNGERTLDPDRLRVPLRNRHGKIAAWCLAVPFLRPADVPPAPEDHGGDGPEEGNNGFAQGVARLYRQVADAASAHRDAGQALIALGHCHVAGGLVSVDSERPLLIGGAEALPKDLFGFDLAYVALGHLHRAQYIGGDERVRYSGSPLPLSFSEIDYPHQIVRIDLDGEQAGDIVPIRIPRFVDLLRVPKRPAPLREVLAALEDLDLPLAEPEQRPYLEVPVLLDAPEPGLRARIEKALDDKPVRLVGTPPSYRSAGGTDTEPPRSLDDLGRLQPDAIFQELYRRQFKTDVPADLFAAFGELWHASVTEADA